MTILGFRIGELEFYKGYIPIELKKYIKEHPENSEYTIRFLDNYKYDYIKKQWEKIK